MDNVSTAAKMPACPYTKSSSTTLPLSVRKNCHVQASKVKNPRGRMYPLMQMRGSKGSDWKMVLIEIHAWDNREQWRNTYTS